MKSQADPLEIYPQKLIALAQRASPQEVSGEEWKTVQASLMTTIALWEAYHAKDRTFQKLIRLIFGPKSEKAKNLFKKDGAGEAADAEDDEKQAGGTGENPEEAQPDNAKKKRNGNGRAGVDAYPGLPRCPVPHPDMKAGDPCTLCPRGCVNRYKASPILRFKGQPPVGGVIYELERLPEVHVIFNPDLAGYQSRP